MSSNNYRSFMNNAGFFPTTSTTHMTLLNLISTTWKELQQCQNAIEHMELFAWKEAYRTATQVIAPILEATRGTHPDLPAHSENRSSPYSGV